MTKKNTDTTITNKTVTSNTVTSKTPSDEIWDSIKDLDINMFSLPSQKVSNYCAKVEIEPTRLYVTMNITSFLPALEDLIGSKYTLEMHKKWLCISKREE